MTKTFYLFPLPRAPINIAKTSPCSSNAFEMVQALRKQASVHKNARTFCHWHLHIFSGGCQITEIFQILYGDKEPLNPIQTCGRSGPLMYAIVMLSFNVSEFIIQGQEIYFHQLTQLPSVGVGMADSSLMKCHSQTTRPLVKRINHEYQIIIRYLKHTKLEEFVQLFEILNVSPAPRNAPPK